MPKVTLILTLISVTLSGLAQVAFKLGLAGAPLSGRGSDPLAVIFEPWVLFGFALYGAGAVIWLNVLAKSELSQVYPFVGIGFALTTVAGWWIFGDTLSAQRLIGIVLVAGGVALISQS